ncbi:MAG: hypothetical protein UF438_00810 [Oribacterium sp.]|nr:hypothetical protein [Oribacterium sp.]
MSLRDDLKKEKKKLSRLSFGEKLQYIFDYYKFWILGVVVLVGLVWSVGSTILHNKPTGFYAMLLNTGGQDLSGEADEAAGEAFAEAAGLDDEKQKILVDTSATFNPNDQSQFSMAQNAKIAALYQSHEIDVMVADPGVFTYYALNGSFVDLRDVLDDETLAGYEASGQVYYIDQHVQELLDQTDYGDLEEMSLGADETIANSDTLRKPDASSDAGAETSAAAATDAQTAATEETSETLDEMSAFAANLMGLATVQPREDFVMPDPAKMQTPIPVGIVLTDAPWLAENALYQKTTPIFGFAVKSERQDAAKSFLKFLEAKS